MAEHSGHVCINVPLPPAPPPPAGSPPEEAHSYVIFGIIMCEVSVTFIALGANIQRYGLTEVSSSRKICGCIGCAAVTRRPTPQK